MAAGDDIRSLDEVIARMEGRRRMVYRMDPLLDGECYNPLRPYPVKRSRRERGLGEEDDDDDDDELMKVRIMLPMSIQCNSCDKYTYEATKIDGLKRDDFVRGAVDSIYRGKEIQVSTVYLRCTHCSAPFTIKFDPRHRDIFTVGSGATRYSGPLPPTPISQSEAEEIMSMFRYTGDRRSLDDILNQLNVFIQDDDHNSTE